MSSDNTIDQDCKTADCLHPADVVEIAVINNTGDCYNRNVTIGHIT